MRKVFSALFLLIATMASAQVRLTIESGGKRVGYATMSQKINSDGSKSVDLRMELDSNGQKLTIRSQNTYDAIGNPTRKFMDSNVPGGKLQRQVIATFDKAGANVVINDGGKRSTRQVPLVETAPRPNASEFWFVKQTPKVGEEAKCYVFNMDSLEWQIQTTIYRGRQNIKSGDKTLSAHYIETTGSRPVKAFLDDDGLPYLIEAQSLQFRRLKT